MPAFATPRVQMVQTLSPKNLEYPGGERAYFCDFSGRYRFWITVHVVAMHLYSDNSGWSVDATARLLWDIIPLHKSWKTAEQCHHLRTNLQEEVYDFFPFFTSLRGPASRKVWRIDVSALHHWRQNAKFGPALSTWANLVADRRQQDLRLLQVKKMTDFLQEISCSYCIMEDKKEDLCSPYVSESKNLTWNRHEISPVNDVRHHSMSAHPLSPCAQRPGSEMGGSTSTKSMDPRRHPSDVGPKSSVKGKEGAISGPPGASKTNQAASSLPAAPLESSSPRPSDAAPQAIKPRDLPQSTSSHTPALPDSSVKAARLTVQIPLLAPAAALSVISDASSRPSLSRSLLDTGAYPSPPTSATSCRTVFSVTGGHSPAILNPIFAETATEPPPRLRRKADSSLLDSRPSTRARLGESSLSIHHNGKATIRPSVTTGHKVKTQHTTRNLDSVALSPCRNDFERPVIDRLVWLLQRSETGMESEALWTAFHNNMPHISRSNVELCLSKPMFVRVTDHHSSLRSYHYNAHYDPDSERRSSRLMSDIGRVE